MKPQNYEDFSIVLTKICLISLFIGAVALLSTGTWVVDFFLYHLYSLVSRIGKEQIFIEKNVRCLQILGWEAAAITLLSFLMGVTCYIPMLLITASGLALTLVIRVIRNAFGKAVQLQDTVDFTI